MSWLLGDPAGRVRVLDLGAGTGKLTRAVADAGHPVVAVDPSPAMLAVLARSTATVQVRHGRGEAVPLADGSVDAAVIGQAWHWMDADAAAGELARVLQPGGSVGMAWNVMDASVPWVAELRRLTCDPATAGEQRLDDVERPVLPAPFRAPQARTFAWTHPLDGADSLVLLASTWSWVAVHPRRAGVLDDVWRLAESVQAADATIALAYHCHCFRWRR